MASSCPYYAAEMNAEEHDESNNDPWHVADFRPPPRRPRLRPCFYMVQALKDGTICFVSESRKPYTKRGTKGKFIDVDGCFGSWDCDGTYPAKQTDANRIILMTAIANRLNTKKVVREMVSERLDRIEQRLEAIEALLRDSASSRSRSGASGARRSTAARSRS